MKARFEIEWEYGEKNELSPSDIELALFTYFKENSCFEVTRLDPDGVELNKIKEANQKEILDMFNKYPLRKSGVRRLSVPRM